jgi:hypothetical protein
MAIGRDTVAGGEYGRLPTPPSGTIYVRVQHLARALAIQRHIRLFETQGLPVPEHLLKLATGLAPVADGDDIVLIDTLTGEVVEDVDVAWQDEGDE